MKEALQGVAPAPGPGLQGARGRRRAALHDEGSQTNGAPTSSGLGPPAPVERRIGVGGPGRPSTSREQILHALREHPGLPQIGLVRTLRLGQATVSAAIGDLLAAELVVVTGHGESTGGRRPEHLELNPTRPLMLGLDLGEEAAQLGLLNLRGELVEEERVSFRRTRRRVDTDPLLEAAKSVIDRRAGEVAGIGLAVPGLVDVSSGFVRRATNLDWSNVPIGALFEERLRLPVAVDRNTNACLLAEEWWGKLAGDPSVFVTLGSGVGAALRVNGGFLHGASGAAGEFGHLIVEPGGQRCRCGRRGCLETRASAHALLADYRRLARDQQCRQEAPPDTATVVDIAAAAVRGEPAARRAVSEVADWLAAGLITLITLLNPRVIVLGGELMAAEDVLLPRLREVVARDGSGSSTPAVTIIPSAFRAQAPLVGAATLAFERLFSTA